MYEIDGDLLTIDTDYIVHQANCVTTRSKGLCSQIFNKYPFANIYSNRQRPDQPGSVIIKGNVIALLAQYYPGRARHENDNPKRRLEWFKKGLKTISRLEFNSIAFPKGIGCGIAGGNWYDYRKAIEEFDSTVNGDVYIVNKN